MNQKEQKKLRKSTEVLLSLPDVKGKRRTPTQKELRGKYKLSVRDGASEMKIKSECRPLYLSS